MSLTSGKSLRHLDRKSMANALDHARRPFQDNYLAMYIGDLHAVVTDPVLMRVPADDHMVHRGDAVFEAFKYVDGAVYNLEAHLDRLERSAGRIDLELPGGRQNIRDLTLETIRAGKESDGLARILLSRGPGGFGVNPYECPRPEVYILATRAKPPFMQVKPAGADARRSTIPAKAAFFAGIKNCNYLPNVLMKKQAVEWGADFVFGMDEKGCLTEGATENVGIVTRGGELLFPRLELVLRGTTMLRVAQLAEFLVEEGMLTGVEFRDITEQMVFDASEMLVMGTTIDVTAACSYEGRPIGTGRPGPVWRRLSALFADDLGHNENLRTRIWQAAGRDGKPGRAPASNH